MKKSWKDWLPLAVIFRPNINRFPIYGAFNFYILYHIFILALALIGICVLILILLYETS